MKKLKHIGLLLLLLAFAACNSEDKLTHSDQDIFPVREKTEIDLALDEIFSPYNTIVEYKYIETLIPQDWYFITPVKEELVMSIGEFLHDYWILPLENGSSQQFVRANFPRMIVLVGSPARKKDGSVVLGQAEGGTLIRFTEMDYFNEGNQEWVRKQMHTAFHEYAHLLHQTFNMPDEFRTVTPDDYTRNGWQAVSTAVARSRGMVTPYGTSSVSEDFAEIFSFYITEPDANITGYFIDVTGETDLNKGRAILRTKLNIIDKFLVNIGMNIDDIRDSFQAKLNG